MNHKKSWIEKAALTIIIVVAVLMVLMIVGYGFLANVLINNPEGIGEWFGKLTNGFNSK